MQMLTKILSRDRALFFAILSTGAILFLSLTSSFPEPVGIRINDKIGHIAAYLVLTFFWLMYSSYYSKRKSTLLVVVFTCIFYGIVLEFMQQTLTTTRTASVLDVIANTIGAIMAYFLVFVVKIKVKK